MPKYIRELDGLRGFAILFVLFYHSKIIIFDIPIFQGGFIGVNIFFVISGFLVGSIFLEKIKLNLDLDLVYFLQRRIRRLVPALTVSVIISLIIFFYNLKSSDLTELAKSSLTSIFFFSNFFFNKFQYGDLGGLYKPLLHTWSISLEMQFYIFSGFFFFILAKFDKINNKRHIAIIILIIILSLVYSQFYDNFFKDKYYNFIARLYELFVGIIASYLVFDKKQIFLINFINKYHNFFSLLGIFLIFFSAIFFNEQSKYISLKIFLPVLGTFLIIYFVDIKENFINKILRFKPLVLIGLISYSLYIYHYPIFAFARIYPYEINSVFIKLFAASSLVLISILSYILIEKPLRNKKFSFKKFSYIFIFLYILISLVSFSIIKNSGYKNRFYNAQGFSLDSSMYLKEWRNFRSNYTERNFSPKQTNEKKILIIGDSLAQDLFNMFKQNENLYEKYLFAYYETHNFRTIKFDDLENLSDKKNLITNNENIFQNLVNESDLIIFAKFWGKEKIFNEEFDKILQLKNNFKKDIIIVNNPPIFGIYNRYWSPLEILIKKTGRLPTDNEINNYEKIYYSSIKKKYFDINEKLKNFANENNFSFIDRFEITCVFFKCEILTPESKKMYWDNMNLTLAGSKYLGRKLEKYFYKLLSPKID